jgi:hypothetical protein
MDTQLKLQPLSFHSVIFSQNDVSQIQGQTIVARCLRNHDIEATLRNEWLARIVRRRVLSRSQIPLNHVDNKPIMFCLSNLCIPTDPKKGQFCERLPEGQIESDASDFSWVGP